MRFFQVRAGGARGVHAADREGRPVLRRGLRRADGGAAGLHRPTRRWMSSSWTRSRCVRTGKRSPVDLDRRPATSRTPHRKASRWGRAPGRPHRCPHTKRRYSYCSAPRTSSLAARRAGATAARMPATTATTANDARPSPAAARSCTSVLRERLDRQRAEADPERQPSAAPISAGDHALVADHPPRLPPGHADGAQHPELARALEDGQDERVRPCRRATRSRSARAGRRRGSSRWSARRRAGRRTRSASAPSRPGRRPAHARATASESASTNVNASAGRGKWRSKPACESTIPPSSESRSEGLKMPRTWHGHLLSVRGLERERCRRPERVVLGEVVTDDRVVRAERGDGRVAAPLPREVVRPRRSCPARRRSRRPRCRSRRAGRGRSGRSRRA